MPSQLLFCTIILLALCNGCNSCSLSFGFLESHITGISLSTIDDTLLLTLENGLYEYCRKLDLISGDLSFAEVSCSSDTISFDPIENFDINVQITPDNATILSPSIDDTEISVNFDTNDINSTIDILLIDIFIHPIDYSYFYSLIMKTLFIFTKNTSNYNTDTDIGLIYISWNPLNDDLDDYLYGLQINALNTQISDHDNDIILDSSLWINYDNNNMNMFQVSSFISDCDHPQWLRYNIMDNIFELLELDPNNTLNITFQFEYIGTGFEGIDSISQRAYDYDSYSIWYYQSNGDNDIDNYNTKIYNFTSSELASFWAVLWFIIILVVLCCCLCVCVYCKKKNDKLKKEQQHFGGMSQEQYYDVHT